MAYITAQDVAAIRSELKQAFPRWKFSVRKGSGSSSVEVTILQGTVDFSENLQNGHCQVNQYWIDQHWSHEPARAALKQINEIMHHAPGRAGGRRFYDNSDAMIDYFDTAFYTNLNVGTWNKYYALIK